MLALLYLPLKRAFQNLNKSVNNEPPNCVYASLTLEYVGGDFREYSYYLYTGKSLNRRKVLYHLSSCQSTLSLALGKEENKICV